MHAKFIILASAVVLTTDAVLAFQFRGSKNYGLSERDYDDSIYSRSLDDFDLELRDVDGEDLCARSFDEYELESRSFDDYYDLEASSAHEDSDLFARGRHAAPFS
ncbi:hypothetical protein BDQ12DRAFT_662554 [Crucibulum laeve]|uniref:Uncharacterized protein n=1 Tax=Crucibulum laeve TaxID=68775 RepID=A0A5C3MFJ3_9AGAR|nr:hypothetical protein BDQ12DRAFT_662554 [Crucibulum laeve]